MENKIPTTSLIIEDNSPKRKKIINDINTRLNEYEKEKSLIVPPGYVEFKLSTMGKIGAPKSIHVRNFDTKDIANLALTEQYDLPEKVCQMLDSMIFEKDTSVLKWHEKEVIELLVRIYLTFFSNKLPEMELPLEQSDFDFLRDNLPKEEYDQKIKDLRNRKWIPRSDIDLSKVETYEISESFKNSVTVTNKKSNFSLKFTYPEFGDIITIKKFIDKEYEEKDKRFSSIRQMLQFRKDMEDNFKSGQDVDLSRVPTAPDFEIQKFREYEAEKALYSIDALKALHLKEFNGEDVREKSLSDRIKLVQDPRFDINVTQVVDQFFKSQKFGVKDEVTMYNDITHSYVIRRFNFRLVDLLSAVQSFKSDEYAVSSDD